MFCDRRGNPVVVAGPPPGQPDPRAQHLCGLEVPGGPERVESYQAVQARDVSPPGGFVASFIVTPAPRSETLFVGLYKVLARGRCGAGERDPILAPRERLLPL